MENEYKEVYFDQYCQKCRYADLYECKDPCNECLSIPVNVNSHVPLYFEEKDA